MTKLAEGSVVVITGAAGGIGRATALAFARRGSNLILGDINEEALERTAAATLTVHGVRAIAARCDVRDDSEVQALVALARSEFGRVDVMVNNAGIGYYARVEDTPVDRLRELFELNVLGVQRGLVAVVPIMRSQGSGHIVVVGSVNGKVAWPYHGAYSATKFALTGLIRALRMELAGSGVKASLVLPVNVRTGFFAAATTGGPGYKPNPPGAMHSPASVARTIVRAVDRGSPEFNTVPAMRLASAISEAFPALQDAAGSWWYRRKERERLDR
ncbi:MAG TPA: SDR family NAD(P)-dependent oxidoreductase [Tepidiformaceae bacterium]|nr:SDR family NAD(P)-dependent oxidoreductase [Tepidiformaceae bacterium]